VLPTLNKDSLRITVQIERWGERTPRYVLPLLYADNPVDSFSGPLVRNLSIEDADGRACAFSTSAEKIGPIESEVVEITGTPQFPLTLAYGLDFGVILRDTSGSYIPLSHVDPSGGFVLGSYAFVAPCLGTSLTDIWRIRVPIDLRFDIPSRISVVGAPRGGTTLRNVYELLFLQIGFGMDPVAQGEGAGQPFALYDLSSIGLGADAHGRIVANFTTILGDIVPLFGGLNGDIYTIMLQDSKGGLEGTFGFSTFATDPANDSSLNMVLAHEAIHNAVGVNCGELDDPWWKEGTTYYLGFAVSSRLGLVPKSQVAERMLRTFDFSDPKYHYAPSSDHVRENLFYLELYDLVYGKGSQIAMLMDRQVRFATGNTVRLDEVTGELTRRFDGAAFSRDDLIEAFEEHGSTDVTAILDDYADRTGTIPDSLLQKAFGDLDSLGAFGAGPLGKRTAAPVLDVYP
jgi:hypothetical protein